MPRGLIYILDDDDNVRISLGDLLESINFSVESFARADDFLVRLQEQTPDCVLMDLRMPGVSGLELLGIMQQRQLNVPVIIITAHGDVAAAVQSMKLGAVDVLLKPFSQDSLLKAIESALHPNAPAHPPAVAAILSPSYITPESAKHPLALLSPRERQILDLIVAGRSSREIGEQLGISPATVNNHRTQIKAKMKAKTVAHLLSIVAKKAGSR